MSPPVSATASQFLSLSQISQYSQLLDKNGQNPRMVEVWGRGGAGGGAAAAACPRSRSRSRLKEEEDQVQGGGGGLISSRRRTKFHETEMSRFYSIAYTIFKKQQMTFGPQWSRYPRLSSDTQWAYITHPYQIWCWYPHASWKSPLTQIKCTAYLTYLILVTLEIRSNVWNLVSSSKTLF